MILSALIFAVTQVEPELLWFAHAHNDYLHERPLHDALSKYFASVEVDVFLVDGELRVGHDRESLEAGITIESLYLKPLAERAKQFGGQPYYSHAGPLWILVDIKADGVAAYAELKRELARYPELKSEHFRFIISGDRPVEEIVKDGGKFAALDGRWNDLGKGYSKELMPWVSESWFSHFQWLGVGVMPAEQQEKLDQMVKDAHGDGRKLRFWGAPDMPNLWETQFRAKVDWINTDRLADLSRWYGDYQQRSSGGRL
ncbi:MAG: hypothetical protein KF812_00600 [Fimbriimonadaceae bacterium]|nr:hypothetical protein [Fimbriimonadaceae bacterium]